MPTDEYDSPWKEAIETYFAEFMHFFFPVAAREIDWSRGYEFLDKELQQITRDASVGRRVVDKLVRIWRLGGEEAWLLIHIEVQGEKESEFNERMFVYHYRLYDRFRRVVVSLAVLTDRQARWRPKQFSYELWGCSIKFRFPIIKLRDYEKRWLELQKSDNPFAVIVMAHLKTQQTKRDDVSRYGWKLKLIRGLYERQFSKDDVRKLFRFIDWLMRLPEGMEDSLWQELHRFEEENRMPYVTSVERIGMQRGLQQGLQQGLMTAIKLGLKLKFGDEGLRLLPEISALTNVEVLQQIASAIETADTADEVREVYQS